MDIAKARFALAKARAYPDQHLQSSWIQTDGNPVAPWEFPVAVDNSDHPPCGTTMCLAGWISFLNAPTGTVIDAISGTVIEPGQGYKTAIGIAEYGRMAIDATDKESFALFWQTGTADACERVIDFIEDHPDASPDELTRAAVRSERER